MSVATEIIIDVEKIMEEIRRDIAQKGYERNAPAFEIAAPVHAEPGPDSFDPAQLGQIVSMLSGRWGLPADHPIQSRRGPIGKCIIFVKKIIRKCIRFHVNPIVIDQNENNRLFYEGIRQLSLFAAQQNNQSGDRAEALAAQAQWEARENAAFLQDRLQTMMEENRALKAKVADAASQMEGLERAIERLQHQAEILSLENRKLILLLENARSEDVQ